MKRFGFLYLVLKSFIRLGLYFYFRVRKIFGLDKIPQDRPVLLLSNHQNALLDVLLITSRYPRPMHYLARSDVFKRKWIGAFLRNLQMHPAFRLRDGYEKLSGNYKTFEEVAEVLRQREHVLLFPEASHCLDRRVRPLNKGFTRLLVSTLKEQPDLDLVIVPVGQNYTAPLQAGESSHIHIGEPLDLQAWIKNNKEEEENFLESRRFARALTLEVEERLKDLTTHLAPFQHYEDHLQTLESLDYDFRIPLRWESEEPPESALKGEVVSPIARSAFRLLNAPFILFWKKVLKPRVPETEFTSTFRFAFALLGYSFSFAALFFIVGVGMGQYRLYFGFTLLFLLLNRVFVRMGITQKRPAADRVAEPEDQPH